MARRDFYEVLGVPGAASQAEIRRAYRKLARKYHPDMNKDPAAEDRFKEVSEAYGVLSDPEQRSRYDRLGPEFDRRAGTAGAGRPSAGRAAAGAARRRPGRRSRASAVDLGGDDVDLGVDDLFEELFGSRFGDVGGADQEAEILLSVEDAYRGGRRLIELSNGRSIEVTIPPGVRDGQRLRLAGQGGQGFGDGPPGDLYLVVRSAPDRRWRLEGRDLHVDLPLAPWEAALGTTVALSVPDGDAKVEVAPGTSTGQSIRVPGRGLPRRSGAAGDLVAEVRIVVPRRLSAEERRLFEELSRVSRFAPRRAS